MSSPGSDSASDHRPVLYGGSEPVPEGPIRGPIGSFRRTARERSLAAAVYGAYCFIVIHRPLSMLYRPGSRFRLGEKEYVYVPGAFSTERRVEIPVALAFLREGGPAERILEVGNSLALYRPPARTVVDKFELSPDVQNVDVVDYSPERPFDRIVSVSTLEHIGYDEPDRDPAKFDRAVRHLLDDCLSESGSLLATLPIGYNPAVDGFIARGHDGVGDLRCMERVSASNDWREISAETALSAPSPRPYPGNARVAFWRVDRRSP